MSDDVLFNLTNINKRFVRGKESIPIFEGLSMSIYKGDFISIMGPSGSGKTTLLNMLGGVDKPSSGQINFLGGDIASLSEGKLANWRADHVGFIFQFYNLMPMLTAEKNVELPLLLKKMSSSDRKKHVRAALKLVGIADRKDHKPKEMSGGQQQRVAIARAIVTDPDVLLCDEPTGDLDRTTATQILEMLKSLNQEFKKTIIMVTHDAEAANYASCQLHLDKGEFVEGSQDLIAAHEGDDVSQGEPA